MGNPAAQVITSSPGRSLFSDSKRDEVSVLIAIRFAEEPELTKRLFLIPRNWANSRSKAIPSFPNVSQKSNVVFTAATTSNSVKVRAAYGIGVSPGINSLLLES